jgi:hypothetical protein
VKIAIDFDDVIMDYKTKLPISGARERICDWYDMRHEITIFTSKHDAKWTDVRDFLDTYNIPFHRIICNKPFFDLFIDDKCERFEGWDKEYLNG